MKLVVAGGGTGGHLFPALDVLKRAMERGTETLFVGTERGLERKEDIPGEKIFLETYPLRGVSLRGKLKALYSFIKGTRKLGDLIRGDFKSITFGGYPCVPVGLQTLLRRKPLYIHEQNSVPSMTNRIFHPFSRKTFITFEYTKRFLKGGKVIRTGFPVRRELLKDRLKKEEARVYLDFDPNAPLLLFMGGSQGASFINNLALKFAKETDHQVLLLSGKRDYKRVLGESKELKNLKVLPFRRDMGVVYSGVDVAVCRAGAGTISELSLFKIPALLIPFPYAAGDHQYYNAKEIEDLGGAFVLRQEEAEVERVVRIVERILSDMETMGERIGVFANPEATDLILDEILKD